MTSAISARALNLAELTELARSYAENPNSWAPALRVPEQGQERFWSLLHSDAHVDVWLLAWLPGHATDLHDHGRSSAAFSVARGTLAEVRVGIGGQRSVHIRSAGDTTWVSSGVVHDVHGAGDGPAVSIHAYSPPLTQMTYYGQGSDGRLIELETVETHDPEQGPRR